MLGGLYVRRRESRSETRGRHSEDNIRIDLFETMRYVCSCASLLPPSMQVAPKAVTYIRVGRPDPVEGIFVHQHTLLHIGLAVS